jgi:Carbohydrate kinase/YjeF-related protein N-terminus
MSLIRLNRQISYPLHSVAATRNIEAGVHFADEPPAVYDLAIDALLGIEQSKPVLGVMADWLRHMQQTAPTVLCVDVKNAINNIAVQAINTLANEVNKGENNDKNRPVYCLSLLTLKPGLFTAQVQADRLAAAQTLADRFGCVVILKGAGSVIAASGQTPCINASGNVKLATEGTGDLLVGSLAVS